MLLFPSIRVASASLFVRNRFNMATLVSTASETQNYGVVEASIRRKLTLLFQPINLIVTNDSHTHAHHAAMRNRVDKGGETHFTVEIVSDEFKGKNTLMRHRMIHKALEDEFAGGLHALCLKTKTAEEAPPFISKDNE